MVSAPSSKLKLAQARTMSIQVCETSAASSYSEAKTGKTLRSWKALIISAVANFETPVAQQLQEMQLVREKVYNMEQTHMALKQK